MRMRALRHNRAKRMQKNWHAIKLGLPMNLEDEIEVLLTVWWCKRSKRKIGRKFADSFMMQKAPATGDNVRKEHGQTCLILGTAAECDLPKMHALETEYAIE